MTGRADYLKLGTWNATCDRCTFKFKASDLRKTWDNLYVCPSCWESRHPADFFRAKEDNTSVPWTNPDDAGDDNDTVGDADTTLTVGTDSTVQYYSTTLTANRTITLDTTGARTGSQFIIYRTDGAAFTLDVGGLQTIPASLDAVVTVEYNGSAWVLKDYTITEL